MNRQACIDAVARRLILEGAHPRSGQRLAAAAVSQLETEGWISFDKDDISATNILPR